MILTTPLFAKNDINHTLICKSGGYVIFRHNKMRDTEAELLREVCRDVRIEPELMPMEPITFERNGNNAEKARLDISARGIWSSFEKTFFDVRVLHPNATSYRNKTLPELFRQHEREKKRLYNNRVIQVEKGTFTPLVFSTNGGMAPEATRYHKRLAELIAMKRNERYSEVMNYIRTRLRFDMLRSVLVSIRGVRGKPKKLTTAPISSLSFNLIPNVSNYECP